MPSASKTLNYDLNQWTSNEYPRRTDFVEDNAKVDAVLKRIDDTQKSNMPNLMINHQTGKTFRYGYQVSATGIPQVISEEVL